MVGQTTSRISRYKPGKPFFAFRVTMSIEKEEKFLAFLFFVVFFFISMRKEINKKNA